MRTLGSEVVRGRWGRSSTGRSRTKSLRADDVAVHVCCTTFGLGVKVWLEAAWSDMVVSSEQPHRQVKVKHEGSSEIWAMVKRGSHCCQFWDVPLCPDRHCSEPTPPPG